MELSFQFREIWLFSQARQNYWFPVNWMRNSKMEDCFESDASVSEKRSNASKLTDAAKATAETGSELRKNQKQQSMHKRGHKEEKNGSKHLLRRLHSPQPSAIPVSQAAPFSAKKIKSLDLYRPIISASFYSQLRYEYAQAADRGRGIKTAQIGGTKKAAAPSAAAKPSMNQTSRVKPTQSAAGTPKKSDDPCALWEKCAVNQNANVSRWLKRLPSCPCRVQLSEFLYNRSIYDKELDKYFDWGYMQVDQRAILRRTAQFCIRQRPLFTNPSLSAQVCCYDSNMTLITRGVGAGTPFLVSPDWYMYRELHIKHDVLPIQLCNGDWTRYHAVRPPNNGRNCTANPDDVEYARQVAIARDF
ncbi:unnamed protein product [Porites lobata]|uniref:AMOP domain-containing protein n=1 Tax=Porites lobata TaxID=104759 RepID=A0ABN8QSV8_9CNID|nr:unnamed protein product [Porites lobata]